MLKLNKLFNIAIITLLAVILQNVAATATVLDVSNYADMSAAVAAQGDNLVTLVVSNNQVVKTNLTIPENVKLVVVPGGVITTIGNTITIKGAFECGQFQCFIGSGFIKFWWTSTTEVIPEWWGAKGDGVSNDSVALQAAFQSIPSGGTINFGTKTFNIKSNVVCKTSANVKGNATIKGNGYIIFEGALQDTGQTISEAVSKGAQTVTVTSTKGIAPNDLLIIQNRENYSFAPYRPYYQDGEFLEVSSVAPNSLTFKNPLQTSYSGVSTNKIYKIMPITINIAPGMKFYSKGDFALRISYNRNSIIDSIECTGGKSAAFAMNKSYNCQLIGGNYVNKYRPPTGENYGIVIINSQNITVSQVTAHGTRHGTTAGGDSRDGSVPCRNISFIDCTITNDVLALQAADFHGNTIDSSYIRCNVAGPISLSGTNVSAVNCTAIANGANAPLQYTEISGGTISFLGCNVSFAPESTATKAVGGTSSTELSKITRDYALVVDDLTVNADANTIAVGVIYHAAIGTVHSSFKFNNIKILNNLKPGFRVLDCTLANPAKHNPPPLAPETISLTNVVATLGSSDYYLLKSGDFTGTDFTIPDR
jgi:hypothetical protein